MWNHFRSELPGTNNKCEGYASRLKKRCTKSHVNLFEMIMVLQQEQIHYKISSLQIEGGQQPPKKQKRDVRTDSKLYDYEQQYMLCEFTMEKYMSQSGFALKGVIEEK